MAGILESFYTRLIDEDDDHGRGELPESAVEEVPQNAARLVGGLTLQQTGDRLVDPKTVLAWMVSALGAPAFAIALLVPIREAGSLLPQAMLVPLVRRFPLRSRVWAIGAVGQGIAVLAIAASGFLFTDLALGLVVLGALAIFSLFRAVSSISAKDIIGKTIPFGQRGSVTGVAASVAGLAAIAAGTAMGLTLDDTEPTALALVIGGAALLWFAAAGVFLTVEEYRSESDPTDPAASLQQSWELLGSDRAFRRFVIARSLLLVSALSPPFVVAISTAIDDSSLSGVGSFVVATGIAGLVASPIWGRLADRSSRLVMAASSAGSAVVVGIFLVLWQLGWDSVGWLGPVTYLLLAVTHAGARMGRKTYVVDMAKGDLRTSYVATSNTIIGFVLLGTGALTAALSTFGAAWALGVLAVAGLAGGLVSFSMDEIHST